MSRTQVICAIAVGTIAMVVVALSYAVGLNPLRSSVDAQDPGPQAAQIAGLDVIDAADADFLLLGGPIQAAFVPDTDEQLAFPVNVLASADPDTGGLGFLITDPLAETFPLYGAGETFLVLCPEDDPSGCARLDGRTWLSQALVSVPGAARGAFDRHPQVLDFDGDGTPDLLFLVPPTVADLEVARTAQGKKGTRREEIRENGEIALRDIFERLLRGDFPVLVSEDEAEALRRYSEAFPPPLRLDPVEEDDPESFEPEDPKTLGDGEEILRPLTDPAIAVQQAGVTTEPGPIAIWEPGAEPAFSAARFATFGASIDELLLLFLAIPGADGADGRLDVITRPGGVESSFNVTPVRTVRSTDPTFGSALALSGAGSSGFCAGSCVAVGAAADTGDSSVWLIENIVALGREEAISETQPWAVQISGIPNGHRGLALRLADVNLDGALDLLIGVPGADSGDVQAAQAGVSDETGAVYLVEGPLQSGSLAQLASRAYVGGRAGELFGGDIDVADLNADGVPDVLVTSRFHTTGPFAAPTGALYGFFGTPGQVVAQTRSVSLVPGLKLVGWTGDTAISDATASIAGLFSQILGWDAAAQAYVSYIPGLPAAVQGLTDLSTGDAFWIVMDQAATWEQPIFSDARSVALLAGLNLAMWTGPAMDIEAALAGLDAADAVFRWNGVGYDTWRRGAPVGNTLTTLANGDAFFIRLAAAATWQQPAP